MADLTPEEQHFFNSGGDTSKLTPDPTHTTPDPTPAIDPLALSGLGDVAPPAPAAAPIEAPAPATATAPAIDNTQAELLRTALADANQRAADLAAQIAAAQKPPPAPAPQAPDPDTDPLGSMLHQLNEVNRNVAELQSRLTAQQEQQTQISNFQRFQQQVVSLRDQFKVAQPDFDAAYNHLRESRIADLRTFGIPETDIAKQIFQEEVILSEAALKQGKNPAEAVYEMAKRHGYTTAPKPPAAPAPSGAPAAPAPSKLDAISRATAATNPASLPKTPVSEDITVESLKDASDADLNKLVTDPDAWAKISGSSNIPL